MALPPPGVTPNFVNPVSLGAPVLGLSIVVILLTILFVVVRLYSNYHAVRGLGWDDGFCVAATALLLVFMGITIRLRKYARHMYDIDANRINYAVFKQLYVSRVLVGPMMFLAKNSIFFLYYRIFSPKRYMRYMIVIGIIFSFAVNSARTVVDAYYCAPRIGHDWDSSVGITCIQSNIGSVIQGAGNLALNLFIFCLPIPVILQLQLPTKKKIAVLAIFLTAFSAIIVSTISISYRVSLWRDKDITWNGFIVEISEFVEAGVTIMCGSMPALATYSKIWVAKSAYLASLPSRIRSRFVARDKPARSPFRVFSTAKASSSQSVDSTTLHLADYRGLGAFSDSNTKTEVYGAPSADDIEMGVIVKSVKVEQTSSGNGASGG